MLGSGGVVPSGDRLAGPDRPGTADGDDIVSMTAAVGREFPLPADPPEGFVVRVEKVGGGGPWTS